MTYRDFEGEREALNRAVGTAVRSGHAREPPDVDQHVPAPGDVTVDDVDPGAVELGVLQALGRVERAGGSRRRRAARRACAPRGRRRGRPRRGSRTARGAVIRDDGAAPLVLRATFPLAGR